MATPSSLHLLWFHTHTGTCTRCLDTCDRFRLRSVNTSLRDMHHFYRQNCPEYRQRYIIYMQDRQTERQASKMRNSHWSLTLFNNEWKNFKHPEWKLEGQEEIAPETGKLHYQGMLHTGQVRFSAVKKVFPQAHIEACRDPVALKKYVHKTDTRAASATVEDYAERPKISRTKFFEDVYEYIHSNGSSDAEYSIIHDDDFTYLTQIVNAMIDEGGDWAYSSMAVQPITRAIWRDYRQSMWNSFLVEQSNGVYEEEGTEEIDLPEAEDDSGSEDSCSQDSSESSETDEGSDDGGDSTDQSEG